MLLLILLILLTASPLHAQTVYPRYEGLSWHKLQPGLDYSEADMQAGALRLSVRLVIARIDPRSFDLSLVLKTRANGMTGTWNVDSAGPDAAFAFNAGQFKETGPWGWLVLDSREERAPGYGPLSAALAIDTTGRVEWLLPNDVAGKRFDRAIRYGFQSYPLLLFNGRVPNMVRRSPDVNRTHRDARLILAERNDGTLLLILTRYEGFGGMGQRVPIGLTVPESVALATSLGVRNALMLDGGISAQLMLRDSTGTPHAWKGLRNVPLALVGRAVQR